jgi:hypothetical protein
LCGDSRWFWLKYIDSNYSINKQEYILWLKEIEAKYVSAKSEGLNIPEILNKKFYNSNYYAQNKARFILFIIPFYDNDYPIFNLLVSYLSAIIFDLLYFMNRNKIYNYSSFAIYCKGIVALTLLYFVIQILGSFIDFDFNLHY